MNKMDELLNAAKLTELLAKKREEEKISKILWVIAIVSAIAAIVLIAHHVYKFFAPDYMDDFEDEFEDEFEDDFFDDEDEYDE